MIQWLVTMRELKLDQSEVEAQPVTGGLERKQDEIP